MYDNNSYDPEPQILPGETIIPKWRVALFALGLLFSIGTWFALSDRDNTEERVREAERQDELAELEGLAPGTCFDLSVSGRFQNIREQPCDATHDSEVIVQVTSTRPSTTFVNAACAREISAVLADMDRPNLPDDLETGVFFADEEAWAAGHRTLVCWVHSPAGIDGPIMTQE